MYLLIIKDLNVGIQNIVTPVLKNINIKIKRNQIVALIGKSGAGKTLLAKTISGLLANNLNIISGEFFYSGKPVTHSWFKKKRGRTIFYSPQNASASLNPMIKIKNQIDEVSHIGLKEIRKILLDLNLPDPSKILNSYSFELSEGENQRCLLSIAIAIGPEFLILDEPTAALDFSTQRDFMTILKKIKEKYNMTLLVITHNLSLLKEMADYVYIINAGEIVERGSLSSILSFPSHEHTKEIVRFL